jgi:hypothetical protein
MVAGGMNKRFLYFGFIGISIIVIAFLTWVMFLAPAPSGGDRGTAANQEQVAIPESLGGAPRTQLATGPEAIQQISGMHGTGIVIREGFIAMYEGAGKSLTLWVSVSPSTELANDLYQKMDNKMPVSKVFTNRQEITVQGQKVIKVLGMGQEHYYWLDGDKNYWVAVGGTDAVPVVEEVMSK